ncbi:MAG: DNA polymerase III subunit delta [Alistipes sp.]|nr:DNA polymerase III subunit delta [Alistipes sp.]
MAKSKKNFRDSWADFTALSTQIGQRKFAPVYLLMGEEPYFIDRLSEQFAEQVLAPEERDFNQTILYGKDSDAGALINLCRQMPMMGGVQLVILREAQALRHLEQLSLYVSKPSAATILVLCHKEKSLDRRGQLFKQIEKCGVVFESTSPREYEIGGWVSDYVRSKGCTIDAASVEILTEHLGADLSKISNEVGKLLTYLPEGTRKITADHIEQNIGISKEFNNFELTRALSERNMARAMRIADHFARNPKENPLVVTLSTLYTHFQRIFILNYQRWVARRKGTALPSEMELARMLKLPTAYFLKEYQQAATLYPNPKVFAILGLLREYDLKSKGVNVGQTDNGELLKELLLKIFAL